MKISQSLTMIVILAASVMLIGCSDSSVDPITVDTAPPAVPTGLGTCTSGSCVKLIWDTNTADVDFKGFRVYRITGDQALLLTQAPVSEARFMDPDPLASFAIYAVSAVDFTGNESARAEVVHGNNPTDLDLHRQ